MVLLGRAAGVCVSRQFDDAASRCFVIVGRDASIYQRINWHTRYLGPPTATTRATQKTTQESKKYKIQYTRAHTRARAHTHTHTSRNTSTNNENVQ